jgi:hypothetical protein
LIVTASGVLVGMMIEARADNRGEHPRYA